MANQISSERYSVYGLVVAVVWNENHGSKISMPKCILCDLTAKYSG